MNVNEITRQLNLNGKIEAVPDGHYILRREHDYRENILPYQPVQLSGIRDDIDEPSIISSIEDFLWIHDGDNADFPREFLGLPFGINADTITGSREWSNTVSKEIKYGFSVPKCLAGTNGNNNVTWTFYQDDIVGKSGGYEPIIVLGIPNDIIKVIENNNKLSIRLELIMDNKKILKPALPIKFVPLLRQ